MKSILVFRLDFGYLLTALSAISHVTNHCKDLPSQLAISAHVLMYPGTRSVDALHHVPIRCKLSLSPFGSALTAIPIFLAKQAGTIAASASVIHKELAIVCGTATRTTPIVASQHCTAGVTRSEFLFRFHKLISFLFCLLYNSFIDL